MGKKIISIKKTAEIKKSRVLPTAFSTHTRRTPTIHEKMRKAERKHKKKLVNYDY